jgi:hypothetical protein
MPPPLHKRRSPATGGTEARPKSENENEAPHSYITFEEEFNRRRQVVPFPLSPEAGQAAMFALALHGAGRPWDQVRFLQKPEPGLGPEDGLRGEASNRHVRAPEAGVQARRATLDNRDTYVGGHSYRWAGFDLEKKPIYELRRIQEIHADLDFYKVPAWSGAAPEMVQGAVFETLARARGGIARPGLVVFSGRGLQLVWLLETGIDPKAARKAETAMRALVQILEAFGADEVATDVGHLLRLPGTINTKSGDWAWLLKYEPDDCQNFDELCLSILCPKKPKAERPVPKPKPEAPAPKAAVPRSPEAKANFRAATAHKRLADILRIVMGKWRGRVPKGYRNVVAHLVACELIQTGCADPHGELNKWCARYTDGHSEDEIRDTFKTVRAKRDNYGARKLGAKLGITADDVHRFGLTAIAAGGETDEQFRERRRKRNAELKRQRREAAGATPRSQSKEQLKPWKAAGVGRTTFFKRQKKSKPLKRIKNFVRSR